MLRETPLKMTTRPGGDKTSMTSHRNAYVYFGVEFSVVSKDTNKNSPSYVKTEKKIRILYVK